MNSGKTRILFPTITDYWILSVKAWVNKLYIKIYMKPDVAVGNQSIVMFHSITDFKVFIYIVFSTYFHCRLIRIFTVTLQRQLRTQHTCRPARSSRDGVAIQSAWVRSWYDDNQSSLICTEKVTSGEPNNIRKMIFYIRHSCLIFATL